MKKLIGLFVSLLILSAIYYETGLTDLKTIFYDSSPKWLFWGGFMFLPTIMTTAWRLQILSPPKAQLGLGEATQLVLSASSLNMILPSKMGDIAKGYFIAQKGGMGLSLSLSLVIFEKSCDMLSLMLWCIFGLVFLGEKDLLHGSLFALISLGLLFGVLMISSRKFPNYFFRLGERLGPANLGEKIAAFASSWQEMCSYIRTRKKLAFKVATISVIIWFLHLLQIWFFILMLNGSVPFLSHLALTPLAIFAGLIPLTFAGMGTRDAALIFFLRGYLAPSMAAALGILCTLRYIIPAILGLPFLNKQMVLLKSTNT